MLNVLGAYTPCSTPPQESQRNDVRYPSRQRSHLFGKRVIGVTFSISSCFVSSSSLPTLRDILFEELQGRVGHVKCQWGSMHRVLRTVACTVNLHRLCQDPCSCLLAHLLSGSCCTARVRCLELPCNTQQHSAELCNTFRWNMSAFASAVGMLDSRTEVRLVLWPQRKPERTHLREA